MAMAWCFEDEATPYSDTIHDSFAHGAKACVPSLWLLEITNTLLIAERRKRITNIDVARYIALLRMLPIEIAEATRDQVFDDVISLARKFMLSAYDAAYLELAMRKGLPLATRDQALIAAAEKLNIACI